MIWGLSEQRMVKVEQAHVWNTCCPNEEDRGRGSTIKKTIKLSIRSSNRAQDNENYSSHIIAIVFAFHGWGYELWIGLPEDEYKLTSNFYKWNSITRSKKHRLESDDLVYVLIGARSSCTTSVTWCNGSKLSLFMLKMPLGLH
jgi:hypothetical protein